MARREIAPEALARDEDLYGNNAAFTCPLCGKVFIVSQYLNHNGRPCTKCGESTGHIKEDSGGRIEAFIEWGNIQE